ncbi:MAG TPA: hypothetical protein VG738_16930 [Chitinophagaceae bacterium]|nr:hypothetical protein [Chitinophagaceae bacterium]
MQRIVLAVNALELNTRSIDFAAYIAGLTCSKLTGVFLKEAIHDNAAALKTPFALPYVETITAEEEETVTDRKKISQNKALFESACVKRDVTFEIEIFRGRVSEKIAMESRFADVILVGPDTCFDQSKQEGTPTRFVRDLLTNAECPVIIVPESFDEIDEIIFAYDGSRSGVYAIKQFTYLFPELSSTKITMLHITEGNAGIPGNKIKQWLEVHYPYVHEESLKGNPSDEMFGFLLQKRNKFVVLGSFGRGALSLAVRPSTSLLVLKTLNLPIFIAHI